jgi:hypothetical protein
MSVSVGSAIRAKIGVYMLLCGRNLALQVASHTISGIRPIIGVYLPPQ